MIQKSERITKTTASDLREERQKRGTKTNWARLDALTDQEIEAQAIADYEESGYPDFDGPSWAGLPPGIGVPKKQLTVRIDQDVIDWYKAQGKSYQTRMNAVLRHYMERHEKKTS